jgi:two-component system, NtrC family, nitrogen regulation sensor histidine kinase NtrY
MRFSVRVTLLITLTVFAAIGATAASLAIAGTTPLPRFGTWALAAVLVSPVIFWSAHLIIGRVAELNDDLGNALRATRDGDYGLRLVVRGDREIAELKQLYNELADAVRTSRQEIHNKEVLLDTLLQRTPIGVVLVNAAERVIYSNTTARELLAGGGRLDGRLLTEIATTLAEPLQELLGDTEDALFNIGEETFQITQRVFRLHAQEHRLVLLERLTPELRRQEVNVWKKAIRLINHEINNSIAPISSLFHSARRVHDLPAHRHRLDEIYEMIDERLKFLGEFLESYARFARLPDPHKERTAWSAVLEPVQALYTFRIEGDPQSEVSLDQTQMQQLVINLVRNAQESGSDPDEIVVSLQRVGSDALLRVLDRGRGMSDEVMRQALVPFFTTKQAGTGLGLALCNEIVEAHGGKMRLARREGGGTVVSCWLPAE